MQSYDAIIIGAGHNGLVTAAYLAKSGKKVLVLERRPMIGGIAVTEEIFPGFKYSTCAHLTGTFSNDIIAELELKKHGLEILPLDPLLFAPCAGRKPPFSSPRRRKDRGRNRPIFPGAMPVNSILFAHSRKKLSCFLAALNSLPLPDGTKSASLNLLELAKLGWKFHRLGERDMYEFLRILPMSIADLLNEWFESDLLKAALAGSGILGSFVGPRQQGTAFNFLHHQLGESNGALRTVWFRSRRYRQSPSSNRTGGRSNSEQKSRPASRWPQILTKSGTATGVVLKNGEEISGTAIISSADIKRTFLQLIEPTYLDPEFLLRSRIFGPAAQLPRSTSRWTPYLSLKMRRRPYISRSRWRHPHWTNTRLP